MNHSGNDLSTHGKSRTISSDIIDYAISSPAIHNLPINNDLSSDHSAILFGYMNKINKSASPPVS